MTAVPGNLDLPRLRQGLYRFFATALLPPEETRVKQLAPAADLLEELGVDTLAFAPPWFALRRSLAVCPPIETLQAQYVNLFETGSDGALCPPVESFYVHSPRRGGPALVTAGLEVEYERLGFSVDDGADLEVDHICPQLELMALLCAQEAFAAEHADLESVQEWSREQRQFTDKHLGRWVPDFAARVRATATAGLHHHVVMTLDAFVDHDREFLHVLAEHERIGPPE